jgi:hypothetical protein|tara:strand:+ start:287 stop:1192 length:906 start_codon:yes stop_codon:yes gene_type:complete
MNTFFLAYVTDSIDATRTGELTVVPIAKSPGYHVEKTAKCATPFGGKGHGLFGPVTASSTVVCAEVEVDALDPPTKELFWFGVVHKYESFIPQGDKTSILGGNEFYPDSTIPGGVDSYSSDDQASKTILKSPIGHKLELSEIAEDGPNNTKVQKDYVLLTTNTNKRVLLDSGIGPGMDKIVISDEKVPGNHIIIQTGKTDGTLGPESMLIECTGNMHINSRSGQLDINVDPNSKSNINIINEGTGDVTMQCRQGDTYITSQGLIKVDSTDVQVNASNTLELNAETSMTLKAPRIDLNPPEE